MPDEITQGTGSAAETSATVSEETSAPESTPSAQDGSSATTPAAETPAQKTAAQRKRLKELLAEDPDLNADYQRELSKDVEKRLKRANRRSLAKEAEIAAEDPDVAMEFSKKVKPLLDAEDEDDDTPVYQRAEWRAKHEASQPLLQVLTTGENADLYAEVYAKHGRADMDKRFLADPEAFTNFLISEYIEQKAAQRAKKSVPAVAEAMATEKTAAAMQGLPTPLSGSAGTDSMSAREKIKAYAEWRTDLSRDELRRLGLVRH